MARKDLLDQCRSRARQTQHENRICFGAPLLGARIKELSREQRFRSLHMICYFFWIVGDDRMQYFIGFAVAGKRLFVTLNVFKRPAEREQDKCPVLASEIFSHELFAHGVNFMVVESIRFQVCQAPVAVAVTWE